MTNTSAPETSSAGDGGAPPPADKLDPKGARALILLLVAVFVVFLNETMMSVAAPTIIADPGIDVSPATGQWLTTAFALTMAVVIPITGWLLQRRQYPPRLHPGDLGVRTRNAHRRARPGLRGARRRPRRAGHRHRDHDAAHDDDRHDDRAAAPAGPHHGPGLDRDVARTRPRAGRRRTAARRLPGLLARTVLGDAASRPSRARARNRAGAQRHRDPSRAPRRAVARARGRRIQRPRLRTEQLRSRGRVRHARVAVDPTRDRHRGARRVRSAADGAAATRCRVPRPAHLHGVLVLARDRDDGARHADDVRPRHRDADLSAVCAAGRPVGDRRGDLPGCSADGTPRTDGGSTLRQIRSPTARDSRNHRGERRGVDPVRGRECGDVDRHRRCRVHAALPGLRVHLPAAVHGRPRRVAVSPLLARQRDPRHDSAGGRRRRSCGIHGAADGRDGSARVDRRHGRQHPRASSTARATP